MNSQPEWRCCASHLDYSLYIYDPLASHNLLCAPGTGIDCQHRLLRAIYRQLLSFAVSHMGHFQIPYVQCPLDYASYAIQRSRGINGGEQTYCILLRYDSIWYCVSCRKPYVHRMACEPEGSSCSITNAALTQFVTRSAFRHCGSGILVGNRSTCKRVRLRRGRETRTLDQIPAQVTQMRAI